jgi:hypothetical protein
MADISFVASDRRLVVSGPCTTSDSDAIVDAVEVFAGLVDRLVLDLTQATDLPREVALAVLRAVRNAERDGYPVAIQTVADRAAPPRHPILTDLRTPQPAQRR